MSAYEEAKILLEDRTGKLAEMVESGEIIDLLAHLVEEHNDCSNCGLRKSLEEALNTGDGVYRP